ncbi:hypothetical protein [Microbacterium azadirachtae]|uniref:Uncharacterized protein n=1 Tax=Microbacterium azadirachtae TaxID=582680 RepID=A0A0F0LNF5_9MICO|nr:hypothetical protein [Microbacterium azadirachtae]KJL33086.1 hypothetical protein RS86_02263 [Microbacterium azadirachtae]
MVHAEPVSAYPPASSRTLEQWLDPGLGAPHGPELRTRLREIADARAALAAMWAAFLSLGISAVLFGGVLFAVTGRAASTVPWMAVGAVFAVVSALFLNRVRRWVPRPGTSLSVRGPGNLRSGLWAAGGILFLLNVLMVIGSLTTGRVLVMVLVDLGMVLLLVSALVVPSAILGRSRPILRRQAHEDPRLAATLERERLSWTPDGRTPMFGPL